MYSVEVVYVTRDIYWVCDFEEIGYDVDLYVLDKFEVYYSLYSGIRVYAYS
jgi:hypothetical protein